MQLKSTAILFLLLITAIGCKDDKIVATVGEKSKNSIRYSNGLAIYKHDGFSIVEVSNPWPKSTQKYTYILIEKGTVVPDSLKQYQAISVPIKNIIVTSTTHIPSLEMLGVENTLTGFPTLKYISSEKVRAHIDAGKIRELGSNQQMNTELIIDLKPDAIIGFGIDNNNPTLDNLQKSGLNIILNGDWNEQSPLGKAEWIKLFGALYNLDDKANAIFSEIENEYLSTVKLAQKATTKPTVMAGAIFENQWYLPQGNSWSAIMIKDGGGNYLWGNTTGTGSLSLSFESVLEKAGQADYWIGEFNSLNEMRANNTHYTEFRPFKTKTVYSFSRKRGTTDGVLYYELAPNRPDLVLKDVVKILHPELLPDYELYFFEKLH